MSPTKALEGTTPYEAWTDKKPSVNNLRVFGCEAFAHIPKDEREKLDSKARKCIFLGYGQGTKGYRLYDTIRLKVFYSRDVKFCEDNRVLEPESDGENDYHFVVDFSDGEVRSQEQPTSQPAAEPVLRRSERERRPPDFYGERANACTQNDQEPTTLQEALSSAESSRWMEAMNAEMNSLDHNKVWNLVELPKDRKAIGSKWVYKIKTGADRNVERYKARLIAQGFSQKYGADYDETFCPVVRLESVRGLIALAVQCGLKLHQIDVTTAFLNGELEEEVYMRQLEGFAAKGKEHLVCKLKKSIYGLKQSPRCWNTALDCQLKQMGFRQSESDPCIYEEARYLLAYMLMTSSWLERMKGE